MTQYVPLYKYSVANPNLPQPWNDYMVEMVKRYIRGEPIFVRFTGFYDIRRTGSIARLHLSDSLIQSIMHKKHLYHCRNSPYVEPDESKVSPEVFDIISLEGSATWDGRKNKVRVVSSDVEWIADPDPDQKTEWVWKSPTTSKVKPKDRLDREIKIGDFISYVLYHFDNNRNAAGIYYGKVTKIDYNGTVFAKNIKLQEGDQSKEKRIKDNSLIVIMSKDLMDKITLARLSVL